MYRPKLIHASATLLAASGLAAGAASVLASAATSAPARETPFMTYTPPSGPQLSASAVANIAARDARAFGDTGEVRIAIAQGSLLQARSLMEGGSLAAAKARADQLAAAKAPPNFCFGGPNAACTEAEQMHAKEVLLAEAAAPTYLVVMSGSGFSPLEHLPRGARAVTGTTILMLIDAHTGIRSGISIGAGTATPKLSELAGYAAYVIPAQSESAQAAMSKPDHNRPRPTLAKPVHSHPRPTFGTVRGTFSANREVVVFRRRSVFARARVRDGRFHALVYEGAYSIAGLRASGGYCRARRIVVRPRHTTVVHLDC